MDRYNDQRGGELCHTGAAYFELDFLVFWVSKRGNRAGPREGTSSQADTVGGRPALKLRQIKGSERMVETHVREDFSAVFCVASIVQAANYTACSNLVVRSPLQSRPDDRKRKSCYRANLPKWRGCQHPVSGG